MELCSLCGNGINSLTSYTREKVANDTSPKIHESCRDKAVAKAMAAREAEKPKVPTLEERVCEYMRESWNRCYPEVVPKIIAIVRDHDEGTGAKYVEWKARAEKAEAKLVKIKELTND